MCFEGKLSEHFGILDLVEMTLSSYCPSLSKTTQPYAIPPQSRIPKLYAVTFLRQNVTSVMLHPLPRISTNPFTTPHPVSSSCFGVAQSHHLSGHISTACTGCSPHLALVPSNSFVCLSPSRRVVLIGIGPCSVSHRLGSCHKPSWTPLISCNYLGRGAQGTWINTVVWVEQRSFIASLEKFICFLHLGNVYQLAISGYLRQV